MSKHPFRVTLLTWLVLSLTAWNLLRAGTTIAWQPTLTEFSATPAPWVTALSGVVLASAGIITLWSIWQGKAWAVKTLLGTTAGYTVWYWGERLIWQSPRPNWLFAVIVNLVIVGFILFTVRSLTREAYERKPQNPKTE